jgi:hypothetical protein
MAKVNRGADLEQLSRLGLGSVLVSEAQKLRRPPQQGGIGRRIGRGQEHQLLGGRAQRTDPPLVLILQLSRHGGRGHHGEAGQLGLAHSLDQLQQSQWVAPGFGQQAIAHLLVKVTRDRGAEKTSGILVGKPLDRQFR